ncbi:MAG TPA: hypothetical protein DGG94_05935 [Micromonosporaceae bacterium]|nr:hypothetical protein [Micromonosporaceae bacterium]HCU49336.1 hypothetical protein [Micromonosporaceae bacterium]
MAATSMPELPDCWSDSVFEMLHDASAALSQMDANALPGAESAAAQPGGRSAVDALVDMLFSISRYCVVRHGHRSG